MFETARATHAQSPSMKPHSWTPHLQKGTLAVEVSLLRLLWARPGTACPAVPAVSLLAAKRSPCEHKEAIPG